MGLGDSASPININSATPINTKSAFTGQAITATTAALATGPCTLHGVSISPLTATVTAGLLQVFDSITASGTVIYQEWVPMTVLPHTVAVDISCLNGLSVAIGGISIAVTLEYQ